MEVRTRTGSVRSTPSGGGTPGASVAHQWMGAVLILVRVGVVAGVWLLLFLLVMYGFVTIPAIMVALFLGGLMVYGYILRHVRSAGVHGALERGAADVSSDGKSG